MTIINTYQYLFYFKVQTDVMNKLFTTDQYIYIIYMTDINSSILRENGFQAMKIMHLAVTAWHYCTFESVHPVHSQRREIYKVRRRLSRGLFSASTSSLTLKFPNQAKSTRMCNSVMSPPRALSSYCSAFRLGYWLSNCFFALFSNYSARGFCHFLTYYFPGFFFNVAGCLSLSHPTFSTLLERRQMSYITW